MKFFYGFIIMFMLSVAVSCDKIKSYSDVPHIDYLSYQLLDTKDPDLGNSQKTLVINFKFVDGDGDLFDPDTVDNNKSKLFLTIYQKKEGVFTQIPDSFFHPQLAFRLPYGQVMERTGQNKTQKGTIQYSYSFVYPMPFDTIQVKLYITDMAEHHSDTIQVPGEIALK
jgi:hypothetical protein